MDFLVDLFGSGRELTALQMSLRALVVFVFVLVLIRLSGRTSFGLRRPFDACTTVLLGAILSRAVVGASPFVPTLCAGFVIVGLHRVFAIASIRWPAFETLVSGPERELVKQGARDEREMRKALITHRDLDEAIRKKTGSERDAIERAVLERDGVVTVKPYGATESPPRR